MATIVNFKNLTPEAQNLFLLIQKEGLTRPKELRAVVKNYTEAAAELEATGYVNFEKVKGIVTRILPTASGALLA